MIKMQCTYYLLENISQRSRKALFREVIKITKFYRNLFDLWFIFISDVTYTTSYEFSLKYFNEKKDIFDISISASKPLIREEIKKRCPRDL